jgi:[ribosomal protein S18]-alanine N-acetyltransferase
MSEPLPVEDLLREDLPALVQLHRAAFPDDIDEDGTLLARFNDELRRPWARLRVLRSTDGLRAYCLSWSIEDEVHLHTIAVAPSVWRKGLGRVLLEDLLSHARAGAARIVLLELRADNAAAMGLYSAYGFEQDRVRKGYYRDGMDALEMSLELPR